MKRACRVWQSVVVFLLLSAYLEGVREGCGTFALRQPRFVSRRQGSVVHTSSADILDVLVSRKGGDWVPTPGQVLEPTQEEFTLAAQLKALGEKRNGQWQKLLAKYPGSNPVVLNAAMHAAVKQRAYEEGLKIYGRLGFMTRTTFTIAMRLLGKLGQVDEADQLWSQLLELDEVGKPEAQARIDAAADNGDIQGAVEILDYMENNDIDMDVLHFSSAIRACTNANDPGRAKEAQELFNRMVTKGIEPNIVTYTMLLRALQDEPSQCCLRLLADMKDKKVRPKKIFAEDFLVTFLKFGTFRGFTRQTTLSHLKQLSLADLQAAKGFIDECHDNKMPVTKTFKLIAAALQAVLEK